MKPEYPHRSDAVVSGGTACRCGATWTLSFHTTRRPLGATWGSDCPIALREALAETEARAERAEAERDAARKDLAECYRLSGADPDGDTWEHLWQTAVDEVRLLRQQYNEMRRELAEATDPDNRLRAMLEWRGVVTPCAVCSGSGRRGYANTSTWRGGSGGQMLTDDVCDSCWGSGDAERPGANLRKLASRSADTDKAVAAAMEARAKELDIAADTQDAYAEGPGDAVRVATLRRAASIVRGGR